jgi:competence protein ComEC
MIGSVLQVRANPYNSLGVAALIILGIDSRQLFDVGFQLSFMAVLSIVYLYPKMNARISHLGSGTIIRTAIAWILRVCAVSVAASLGTLPLTAVYFGKVSIIGLLANIVVIPAVGASVVLGFVTIMAGLLKRMEL